MTSSDFCTCRQSFRCCRNKTDISWYHSVYFDHNKSSPPRIDHLAMEKDYLLLESSEIGNKYF